MKKFFILNVLLILTAMSGMAQQAQRDFAVDKAMSASNHYAYPGPLQEKLTAAPRGYKPFYISHYGRHGSRYMCDKADYDIVYNTLQKADSAGKLTALGQETLAKVSLLRQRASNRLGELTELGAEQHRGIAQRMYERFPEVFKGKVHVDAKSTVVIRCILSMENALQELLRHNKQLIVTHDASEHDMWYMNFWDNKLHQNSAPEQTRKDLDEFTKRHVKYDRLLSSLFNDEDYWHKAFNAADFNSRLFKLAGGIQSTESRHDVTLYNLYTDDEIYGNWLQTNAWWYIHYGAYAGNGARLPFIERRLLRKMIEETDSCLQYDRPGATLRYGHETCVMPLACLMELDNFGLSISDLEQVEKSGWLNYRIFPMACNVQMVFYRHKNKQKDILVKVLLNENEARLPLTPVEGPYYKWSEVRQYYLDKLDTFQE